MQNVPGLTKYVGGNLGAASYGNERSRLRLLDPLAKTPAIRPVPRMPQETVLLMLVSPSRYGDAQGAGEADLS
jgi:hypothetical protein